MNKADTIAIIRSLLSSTSSSYNVRTLNEDFKNETGIDIPLFGYKNLADFFHSIPDTVKLTGIYPVQQVSLVRNEKSGHIVSLVRRQKENRQKRNVTQRSKSDFNEVPSSNSFRLNTVNPEVIAGGDNSETVFYRNSNKKETLQTQRTTSSGIHNSIFQSSPKGLTSKDVLSCSDILGIDLNSSIQIGSYIEVCLCQIFNPHKFYLHLRKNKKKLSSLMNELQDFYESENITFKMSNDTLRPKQICAVLYELPCKPFKWYRAEVTKILDGSEAIVFLLDYGITVKIFKKNLRFLHHGFYGLPRQAILSSLANIRPSEAELGWSKSAIRRFSDLASDKDLIAGIVNLDVKACSVGVALSSTRRLEIHVNDVLVKEGYAEFETDVFITQKESFTKSFKTMESHSDELKAGKSCESDVNSCRAFQNEASLRPLAPVLFSMDARNARLKKLFCI